MALRGFCEHCGKERILRRAKRVRNFVVKGEHFDVEVVVAICSVCGSEVPYPRLDNSQRRKASDAYRRAHGLLTTSEIISVRNRYGLSQRGLARILGWGPITIHRYEQGGIQNRAHDTVLRLAGRDPEYVLARLELCRGLTPLGYKRLRRSILLGAQDGTWPAPALASDSAQLPPVRSASPDLNEPDLNEPDPNWISTS